MPSGPCVAGEVARSVVAKAARGASADGEVAVGQRIQADGVLSPAREWLVRFAHGVPAKALRVVVNLIFLISKLRLVNLAREVAHQVLIEHWNSECDVAMRWAVDHSFADNLRSAWAQTLMGLI